MEKDKLLPYIVYTKSLIGHKVYAISKEEAIKTFKDGKEVDSFECEEVIDSVDEY